MARAGERQSMAASSQIVQIGERPLRIALGAGHRKATGGNRFKAELTVRVAHAVVTLDYGREGFEDGSNSPDSGLGSHSVAVDAGQTGH